MTDTDDEPGRTVRPFADLLQDLDAGRGVTAPNACDRCFRPRARCTCPPERRTQR